MLETLQSLKDEYAAQSTPPRFINRPSDVKIAQVQDDFYGNVGTFNDRNLITDLDDNKNRVLLLQVDGRRLQ